MRLRLRVACLLTGLSLALTGSAQLVTPPTVDWVSVPTTASVGQTVSIGVGGHGNYSDNSDGNNWNAGTMPYLLRIIIDVQRPGQGWTNLHDWLGTWQTPASAGTSFTVNTNGTHYIRVQLMDGRPWYSGVYTYAIGVPNPAPTITSSLSVGINQGQSVSYNITATGNPTSYGASNLPTGLSINTSTGAITGSIPTNGGVQSSNSTVNSTLTATNAAGTDSKTLVWNIAAANITTNGSVSPTSSAPGTTVTLTRAGSANFGLSYTENVIWKPDGSAQTLGNAQLGSQSYTPTGGLGTYNYLIRFVDNNVNFKDQWIAFTVALAPPTSLQTTSVQAASVALSWTAASGATGYNIYRGGTKLNGSPVGGTTYTDSTVTSATSYSYFVRSVAAGVESANSNTVSVTTPDITAPSVPTGLVASSITASGFMLNWTASTDNVGVTAYEVFAGGVSQGTSATTGKSVTGLTQGVNYSVTVRTRDAAGNWSAHSSAIMVQTVDTQAPNSPAQPNFSNLTLNSFTLTWAATTDNIGVTGYQVYMNGVAQTPVGNVLSQGFTGLAASSPYSMTVRARDAAGNWSAQSPARVVTTVANGTPTTTLTAPTNGFSSQAPATFTLTAGAADSDGTIAKVEFYQDNVKIGESSSAPYSLPVTLSYPGSYAFKSRAIDNLNGSGDSSIVNVTVSATSDVLPFSSGFESAGNGGYTTGLLHGQQGWTSSGGATVVASGSAGSLQSVSLPGNATAATISHTFPTHPSNSVVFVDLFWKPKAGLTESTSPRIQTLNATQVALVQDAQDATKAWFKVFNGNGSGGGAWAMSRASTALNGSGFTTNWQRITLRIDYTAQKWDLSVNGLLVAVNLGFVDNAQAMIGSFLAIGHASAVTGLDDFWAGFEHPVFADTDRDGMSNIWEGVSDLIRDNDTDEDGLVNIVEFMLGSDPRVADTDGDGLTDGNEYTLGTSPLNADTDGDGMPDGWEADHSLNPLINDAGGDPDGDGVANLQEYTSGRDPQYKLDGLELPTTPAGITLVAPVPGNQFLGINTDTWAISVLANP